MPRVCEAGFRGAGDGIGDAVTGAFRGRRRHLEVALVKAAMAAESRLVKHPPFLLRAARRRTVAVCGHTEAVGEGTRSGQPDILAAVGST